MIKLTLSLISLAALAGACGNVRVERASRWAAIDYDRVSARHMEHNYILRSDPDTTCARIGIHGRTYGTEGAGYCGREDGRLDAHN